MTKNTTKGERRETARFKKQHGMRITGRGIFVVTATIQKKAEKAKSQRTGGEK